MVYIDLNSNALVASHFLHRSCNTFAFIRDRRRLALRAYSTETRSVAGQHGLLAQLWRRVLERRLLLRTSDYALFLLTGGAQPAVGGMSEADVSAAAAERYDELYRYMLSVQHEVGAAKHLRRRRAWECGSSLRRAGSTASLATCSLQSADTPRASGAVPGTPPEGRVKSSVGLLRMLHKMRGGAPSLPKAAANHSMSSTAHGSFGGDAGVPLSTGSFGGGIGGEPSSSSHGFANGHSFGSGHSFAYGHSFSNGPSFASFGGPSFPGPTFGSASTTQQQQQPQQQRPEDGPSPGLPASLPANTVSTRLDFLVRYYQFAASTGQCQGVVGHTSFLRPQMQVSYQHQPAMLPVGSRAGQAGRAGSPSSGGVGASAARTHVSVAVAHMSLALGPHTVSMGMQLASSMLLVSGMTVQYSLWVQLMSMQVPLMLQKAYHCYKPQQIC